ncbi:hypothetical protein MalM25_18440 [Planctomycetes bacterium MalM25]|nr:hypothetical protein MalM25_18440 [Planctomycetes bacterium MalM25]
MKRVTSCLVLAALLAGSLGCGCCPWRQKTTTVNYPIAPAPACGPTCGPTCQ